MKKFLCKLFIFGIIIFSVIIPINYVFIKLDKSDNDFIEKFKAIPHQIKIANFGSSHGLYDFNYENIATDEFTCFNFGLPSQSLSYDYRLMQNYAKNIADDATIYIPVSYFSFFGQKEVEFEDFESMNKRYYRILPSNLIKQYDFNTSVYVRYIPSLSVGLKDLIKTLLGKSKDDKNKAYLQVASDIDVREDAKKAYTRHIVNNKKDKDGNRIINQEEIDALYALINSCKTKGATPILVTPPYLSEYTNEVKKDPDSFYDDFYKIINQVKKDTGVYYYDYAFDERFSKNYLWFRDADHLNKEGSIVFTQILMEETRSN